jgi:hypothetical protein
LDAERFDRLVESLTRPGSRRGALRTLGGALLGAVGLGALAGDDAAGRSKDRRKGKGKGKGRDRGRKTRSQALPASCCSSGNCTPGAGKFLAKCCYENANLAGANFRRSNLSQANFRGANLANADFSSANLSKACLVDADITGARFSGANLSGVVYCRTRTGPNSYNNSGCDKANSCCPTCVPLGESRCALGGSCCGGGVCESNTCVCPAGERNCSGTCRNLQTDANNCGTCGNACPSGETCQGGVCKCGNNPTCGAGLTCCSNQCVDLDTDLDNCTECGNVCPRPLANATVLCGPGLDENGDPGYGCAFLCDAAFADCDGDPLTGCEQRISSDSQNCGACGVTCPASAPRCCGCRCFPQDSNLCSICQPVSNARLIRRR